MSNPSLLRRLFGGLWKAITWLRLALTNLLFIAMLLIIYFVYLGGSPEPLPERAALLLNPVGSIVDQKRPVEPLQALLGEPSPADHQVLVRDVIKAIELAAADPAINSIVMELDSLFRVGISRSMEIAVALEAFKAAGKPVVAVADFYTQDQYLLSSHADEIITHPMGGVALEGFGAYFNYFATRLMQHWGGHDWRKWRQQLRSTLLASQESNGPALGSWLLEPTSQTAKSGGRLCVTSLCLMALTETVGP